MLLLPGGDLVGVDQHLAGLGPGRKFRQHFVVVVFGDACVDAVVPVVQPADEVVAVDAAVGEQRAAVQAAAVQHGDIVAVADHDQVDIADQRIGGRAVLELGPARDGDLVHETPPEQEDRPYEVGLSSVTTRPFSIESASWPCLSAIARSPNSSRRQPRSAGTSACVVGGDAVEVVDGGDHLGGDAVLLRGHAQQHLEELDGGLAVDRRLVLLPLRQRLQIARQPAIDRPHDRFAPFRALEALRQRAQRAESLDRGRSLDRDVADHVVLEHASARHVAGLRLALAPGRDLDQHRQLLRLAHAGLEPLPGVLGLHPVGLGRREHAHLVAHPFGAPASFEVGGQLQRRRRAGGSRPTPHRRAVPR